MKLLDMRSVSGFWLNTNDLTINFSYTRDNVVVPVRIKIKLSFTKTGFQFTTPQGDPDLNNIIFTLAHHNHLVQSKYNPWTFRLIDSDAEAIIAGMRMAGIEQPRDYLNVWTKIEWQDKDSAVRDYYFDTWIRK